jgi:hypothetical protein
MKIGNPNNIIHKFPNKPPMITGIIMIAYLEKASATLKFDSSCMSLKLILQKYGHAFLQIVSLLTYDNFLQKNYSDFYHSGSLVD